MRTILSVSTSLSFGRIITGISPFYLRFSTFKAKEFHHNRMSERELHKATWEKFTVGDETVLLELYNQHYLGIINYGRTIIEDREFVNDCFTDMLLEFWNKRLSLPGVENVRSYLMTSFRRTLLHRLEAEKRREIKHHESQGLYEAHEVSYEEHVIKVHGDHQRKERLAKALDKLTERQVELIRLKFFDDLDYDEIAEKCGITKRTAYNIIYDAIKLLKDDLYGNHHQLFSLGFSLVLAALYHLSCCKPIS